MPVAHLVGVLAQTVHELSAAIEPHPRQVRPTPTTDGREIWQEAESVQELTRDLGFRAALQGV